MSLYLTCVALFFDTLRGIGIKYQQIVANFFTNKYNKVMHLPFDSWWDWMAILACKPEIQWVLDLMGAGAGASEDFDSRVQPAPDLNFRGCGRMFLFQLAGDPQPT